MAITVAEFAEVWPEHVKKYSKETIRLMVAFQNGGWDSLDKELSDITDEAHQRGVHAGQSGGL